MGRKLPVIPGSRPVNDAGRDPANDVRVWTSTWVCVGVADQIPGVGDLLPATIGDLGLHVQRQTDGSLRAAFNVLQHGSCWTIPAQCRGGHKTACPYVSCGYSLDTDAIPADDGRPAREMRQFIGFNPAKLAPVPLDTVGPFIFVHLGSGGPPVPGPRLAAPDDVRKRWFGARYLGRSWVELADNWRVATEAVAAALSAGPATRSSDGLLVSRDIPDRDDIPRPPVSRAAGPASPAPRGRPPPTPTIGRVHQVFPTLTMVILPEYLVGMVVKPTSPRTCRMLLGFYAPGDRSELPPRVTTELSDAWMRICGDAVRSREAVRSGG